MGGFAKLGLLALASSLFASADAVTFALNFRLFNSTGADATGTWVSRGFLSVDNTDLHVRVFRADGGALTATGCTVDTAAVSITLTGGGTNAPTLGTAVFVDDGSYFKIPLTLPATSAPDPGSYEIQDTSDGTTDAMTCTDGTSVAGSVITNFFNIAPDVAFTFDNSGPVSANWKLDGTLESPATFLPFGTSSSPMLVLTTSGSLNINSAAASLTTTTAAALFDFPEAWSGIVSVSAVDGSTANNLKISLGGFASVGYGVYDIGLKAGAVAFGGTYKNPPRKIRIIWGPAPRIYNTVTARYSPQRTSSNTTHAIFAVNNTRFGVDHYFGLSAQTNSVPLSSSYAGLYPYSSGFSSFDISRLMNGFTSNTPSPSSTSGLIYGKWEYNTYLADGIYTLKRKDSTVNFVTSGTEAQLRDVVLYIDRVPPIASNATFSGGAQAVGLSGTVKIPTTMFSDVVSSDPKWITIVSHRFIGSDGNGFWCTNKVSLSSAYCLATKIRGPPTNLLVEIVAEDEAGNQAVGFLTIPTVASPTVTITVADKRGVPTSTNMRSGGANSLVATKMQFTVVATFSEALKMPYPSLTSSHSSSFTGDLAADVAVSGGGRVLTYTVVESTTVATDTTVTFSIAALAATRSSDDVRNVVASNTVSVYVDRTAPTFPAAGSPTLTDHQGNQTYVATVNMPYFEYIPVSLFKETATSGNYFSPPDKIKITSATTSQNVGLSVNIGALGRAYISGTATSAPTASTDSACFQGTSQSWVKFAITGEDEAGNTVSGFYCVAVVANNGLSASLTFNRNSLTYAEGDGDKTLDATASFTASSNVKRVFAYLETVDAIGADANSNVEVVKMSSSLTTSKYTSGWDAPITVTLLGSLVSAGTTDAMTPAAVTAAVSTVQYNNAKDQLTPGFRTVRVVVTKVAGSYETVVAVTSKTIYVSNSNDAPSLTVIGGSGGNIGSISWVEGTSFFDSGKTLIDGSKYFTLTDYDDSSFTSATLTLATTESASTYGACDAARDSLYLPSSYSDNPSVYGTWNPTTCTLTLRSFTGVTATKAELLAALHAIQYRNSDFYNPTNGYIATSDSTNFWKTKRSVSIKVTDAASASRAAASSTTATAVTGTIAASTVTDHAAFFIWEKLYMPGGMLYSTNQTGNLKTNWRPSVNVNTATPQAGARDFLSIRKFALDFDSGSETSAKLNIPLDFSQVSNNVFAGGALLDYDTATITHPTAIGSGITITVYDEDTTTGTGYSTSATSPAPTFTLNPWDASTGKGVLVITGAASMVAGTKVAMVTYGAGGPSFYIWFDVRQKVCYLDSTNFLTSGNFANAGAASAASTKYIHDPNLCQSLTTYKATVNSAPTLTGTASDYYKTGTTVLVPGKQAGPASEDDGASTLKYLAVSAGGAFNTYFNFYTMNKTLGEYRHDLIRAGIIGDEAAARIATLRTQARGMASFYFERNSFATTSGDFQFNFKPMGQYQANTLPAGNPGEILDANLLFELTPSCMKFVYPVTACVFVGDTPAGYTRSIKVTSQRDCTDSTKGWTPWESLSGVTFDSVPGLICGNTSHFSALGTFLTPLSTNPTTSKAVSMGGSCPNECSGKGYCRSNGKCQCNPGFNGNDCSLRTCPVAESWDGGDYTVHELKECAERGTCNPKTGQCACFPGFEGSACQRTACPNACSGHGQCKLLKDLPMVQATGYSKWETDRLQKCVCDFGYTGLDCSERICPFGDDPETNCDDKRQIQQVKIDFGSLPGDPATFGLFDSDELSLTFRTYFGQNLSVPRVVNIFDSTGAGATNLARSLKSLPGFAVSDVSVTASVASDFTSATYNVTFDGTSLAVALAGSVSARLTATANTVPGNQAMLICPTNSYGSLGCQAAGCRPKYKQARLLSQPTSQVRVSSTAILRQPSAITAGLSTVGKWGVTATITIANRPETGEQTYSVATKIYGVDDGDSVAETPLPPANSKLRNSVALPYGLEVDFDSGSLIPGQYEIKWRLPTCSVTQVQSASAELELVECSKRGNCDRSSGTCKCFTGYSGANCGMQTVVV